MAEETKDPIRIRLLDNQYRPDVRIVERDARNDFFGDGLQAQVERECSNLYPFAQVKKAWMNGSAQGCVSE